MNTDNSVKKQLKNASESVEDAIVELIKFEGKAAEQRNALLEKLNLAQSKVSALASILGHGQ